MNAFQITVVAESAGTVPKPWRDPLFLFAVSAGPLVWLTLFAWTAPAFAPDLFWTKPLAVLPVIVVYPILEEWLFRGRIQGALAAGRLGRYRWAGISAANLVTSLLFAGLHAFSHPPQWAALVLFPSLVFGLFRDRYGRIGPSILLHAFYNAGYFSLWPPF